MKNAYFAILSMQLDIPNQSKMTRIETQKIQTQIIMFYSKQNTVVSTTNLFRFQYIYWKIY